MTDTRPAYALRIHDRAAVVPFPDPEQHGDLTDDIAAHGIQVPLDILDDGTILDGRTRYSIAKALGIIDIPVRVVRTDDPVGYMLRMALRRRHLTTQQRKALAESLLSLDPSRSNLSVAAEVGLSDNTVRKVRTSAEGRGDIPHVEQRTDSLGRQQPATKPERAPEPMPDAEAWADALADPATVEALDAGIADAEAGRTVPRPSRPTTDLPMTDAHRERFPQLAASELSADLADAIHAVRTDKLDPAKWGDRVERMRAEDIAALRSKVAHTRRWVDAWDALLAPRPLSIVGGTK